MAPQAKVTADAARGQAEHGDLRAGLAGRYKLRQCGWLVAEPGEGQEEWSRRPGSVRRMVAWDRLWRYWA